MAIPFAMLVSVTLLRGDEKSEAKLPRPAISIGQMRIQTIPAMPYLSMPAETTFEKIAEPVKTGFDRIFGAAYEAKLFIVRPTMLVYQGNPHFHPTEPFKMEIGVIVAEDAKVDAAADIKIRKTEPFKCATILYTGPVNEQGQAYQKLIPAMTAAGLKPTGEEREMCLYWEGPDSSSNIFMMMVGIE
jgi:effector-binding domain-containing protein